MKVTDVMNEVNALRNNVKQRFRTTTDRLDRLENHWNTAAERAELAQLGRHIKELTRILTRAEQRMAAIEKKMDRTQPRARVKKELKKSKSWWRIGRKNC